MTRFARVLATTLLLAGTVFYAGCSSNAGVTTGATGDGPVMSNSDPMARPAHVAWISARAQRCGFYFDPAKLRASYLAYESKQGATGEAFMRVEKIYDTTFKATSDRVSADPAYCTEKKSADIKVELNRHLAGDFAPNFPVPKVVAQCGSLFDPCDSGRTDQKFESKTFWQKQDANPRK